MTVGATLSVTSTCIEQNENNRPLMNDVQSGSGSLATRFRDNARVNDRGQGVGGVPIMKKTGADMEKSRHSLEEMISHKNDNSSANVVVKHGNINERNGISVVSSESPDDKSKSHAGKLAPIVAENLWDGSLQLNSSITVSAIASFKSGEKMPACKWPNFVEVKGKVRLEAFEKYIQDLSRSRNRGLMVISLHCKGGSSKSGLAGMKEVAKGYKKGERVGLAQLCQGIDLYDIAAHGAKYAVNTSFQSKRTWRFGLGRLPHGAVQRMRLQNEVREYDKTLDLPNSEEKHAAKISVPVSTADVLQSKNLFDDDDDDMPEWCPPNAKLHRQVVPETAMPSRAIISSKILNSNSEGFPCGPAGHLFLLHLLVSICLSFPKNSPLSRVRM
ncbi:hypothetical protein GH714_041445 [Hevea brasiliensis]|uniref:Spen paralogue and orthologue SPOC C-terminal domain-containing protein n=1 Tax=Hevea brasiliensis TaxID=3981 RepID=A0A6A6MX77_HEVBR|nr:hypothetical protein GH714_041445 [Hevea brasiliensis]